MKKFSVIITTIALAGLIVGFAINKDTKTTAGGAFVNPPIVLSWIGCTEPDDSALRSMSYLRIRRWSDAVKKMSADNKRYIIRSKLDLKGDTLKLGKNCCIDFDGGQIYNGVIVGDDTRLIYKNKPIFNTVLLYGTWIVPFIRTSMFADVREENVLIQLFNLTNENYYNRVLIEDGDYIVRARVNNDGILRPKSNTELELNGNITLLPNEYQDYQIMSVYGANNVYIHGKGQIIGDLYKHNYEKVKGTHEWGHGLTIRGCKNVLVEGVTVKNCTGDACSVGAQAPGDLDKAVPIGVPSMNVELRKCKLEASRRQGLTITFASYVTIDSCVFDGIYNTYRGTAPGAAIDLEPDNNGKKEFERGMEVYHIHIKNSIFNNCFQGISSWKSFEPNETRWYRDLLIENCTFDKIHQKCINITGFDDVIISNITKTNIKSNDRFYRCKNVNNK